MKSTFASSAVVSLCAAMLGVLPSQAAKPVQAKKPAQGAKAVSSPQLPTQAVLETSLGKITIKLFPDRAPKTVENFAGLATGTKEWTDPNTGAKTKGKSFYEGTIFHRVIPDFMIQAGDRRGTGTGDAGYKFDDEVKPTDSFDKPGVVAMANAGPNTNGSQFFVTVKATPWLNGKHTIFGEVKAGQDIVDKIANSPRDEMDRPSKEIKLLKVTVQ